MYLYQLWKRPPDGRFYEINLMQDLLGDWLINLAWGSTRIKPKGQTLVFEDCESALKKLPELERRREAHHYKKVLSIV